jgi:predicted dehydrogenase
MSGFEIDRRRLLLGASVAPLAASVAGAAQAEVVAKGQPLRGNPQMPEPPAKRMGYAVVGLGSFAIGQVLPGLQAASQSSVTALVSGNPEKARDIGARYGVNRIYDYKNFDKIADDKDIDCVYIALPVGLHAEYTIRALKAGKHVLCEKPMASTVAECEAMVAAAKAANRQLGVAYRVHFEPNNVEALRRLRAGEIGDIRYFSGETGFPANPAYPPVKWRLEKALGGGGSMYDIGIYALNGCLMYVDEPPIAVSAVYTTPAGDPRFTEVEGGVDWRLMFASGITAQGSSSYTFAYTSQQRILGTKGYIALNPATDYSSVGGVIHTDATRPIRAGDSLVQFAAQLDGFSTAARTGQPHRTPGEMGLRDMRIIQAMYKSADNGGATVKL